jgi:hypothetical protein
MFLKAFLAFVIAGVVLALLVPALHRRGISLNGWMAWGVILAAAALALGPDVWRRVRSRSH